jgi:hypothetical protein
MSADVFSQKIWESRNAETPHLECLVSKTALSRRPLIADMRPIVFH